MHIKIAKTSGNLLAQHLSKTHNAHVDSHNLSLDQPPTAHLLPKHSSRCQTKVDANIQRDAISNRDLLCCNVCLAIEHRIHRLTLLNGAKTVHHIHINPRLCFASNEIRIIAFEHVLGVLSLGVRRIVQNIAVFIQSLTHTRRLHIEVPVVWLDQHTRLLVRNVVRDWHLARHDRPPVIFFWRVSVSNNP